MGSTCPPNFKLSQQCANPVDEVLGVNCMALVSEPCTGQSDAFSKSFVQPGPSRGPSEIETEMDLIFSNPTNENRDLICDLLRIDNVGPNDNLPLSAEFNGCRDNTIKRLRNRCRVHDIPLFRCNLDSLNNLWNTCKNANIQDTVTFDRNICPNLLKNDENYALNYVKNNANKSFLELEEEFRENPDQAPLFYHAYIQQKLLGVKAMMEREENEFSEDPLFNQKYFDELDVMQNCILRDYSQPRNCLEYQDIANYFRDNGFENSEFINQQALNNLNAYRNTGCVDNNAIFRPGKEVNRFCDYGIPRAPNFYEFEEPLHIPDVNEILDNRIGQNIIDNDEKRFSTYAGVFKCDAGTSVGDRRNPYLDFEDDAMKNKNCNDHPCNSNSNDIECRLQSEYHPELDVDITLSEELNQCHNSNNTSNPRNADLCPGILADCSDCTPPPNENERALWNSLNCKHRPANPNNIYGHSCDDDYAACVRYENPNELKKLKLQFQGKLNRDNTLESGCVCANPDCTLVSGQNCGRESRRIIQTNLTYPNLVPHNFLTDDMIQDREKLFEKIGNDKEIYKCVRCGLRNTNSSSSDPSNRLNIFPHSRSPDFLIFNTDVQRLAGTTDDQVTSTNCTTNDLYWYQNEKGFLENRIHQDRTLRTMDQSISEFQEAFQQSEENILRTAAEYEAETARRQSEIQNLRDRIERDAPILHARIREAEQLAAEAYEENMDNKNNNIGENNYLIYIMGFLVVIIIILFLIF
jgi:hypothetical protein